jgi:hypothetical protein
LAVFWVILPVLMPFCPIFSVLCRFLRKLAIAANTEFERWKLAKRRCDFFRQRSCLLHGLSRLGASHAGRAGGLRGRHLVGTMHVRMEGGVACLEPVEPAEPHRSSRNAAACQTVAPDGARYGDATLQPFNLHAFVRGTGLIALFRLERWSAPNWVTKIDDPSISGAAAQGIAVG